MSLSSVYCNICMANIACLYTRQMSIYILEISYVAIETKKEIEMFPNCILNFLSCLNNQISAFFAWKTEKYYKFIFGCLVQIK